MKKVTADPFEGHLCGIFKFYVVFSPVKEIFQFGMECCLG